MLEIAEMIIKVINTWKFRPESLLYNHDITNMVNRLSLQITLKLTQVGLWSNQVKLSLVTFLTQVVNLQVTFGPIQVTFAVTSDYQISWWEGVNEMKGVFTFVACTWNFICEDLKILKFWVWQIIDKYTSKKKWIPDRFINLVMLCKRCSISARAL